MSEAIINRYWCYQCNEVVNPDLQLDLKCPICDGGFLEEMASRGDVDSATTVVSDRSSLSLWAPVLLEMLGGSPRASQNRREENQDDDSDSDPELELLTRRQRTSAILHVLQSIQDEHRMDPDSMESRRERGRMRRLRRERLLLMNPFREAILQSSLNDENRGEDSDNSGVGVSFGDYFLGPGLDLLLQHLAENDPSRCGTPPAKKEAVDALPTVKIAEAMSCSVCLDDFIAGTEAREMPCKHKFHDECILPWLEMHSSCPVCRFQLPADETKMPNGSSDSRRAGSGVESSRSESSRSDEGDDSSFWIPLPWPFNSLLSLTGSENGGNSSSSPSNAPDNSPTED